VRHLQSHLHPRPTSILSHRGMVTLHHRELAHPVERSPHVGKAQAAQGSVDVAIHEDMERVLWSEDALKSRVKELGRQIAADYADKRPLVLGVLTGAFTFTADLVRGMEPCPAGTQVNFVRASSYGSSTESSGQPGLKVDLDLSTTKGRHVVLVEDIVDTGLTLTLLKAHLLQECQAASVSVVCLLDKAARRKVNIAPDYKGFDCPDFFIVGYGLDFNEYYRTLPYIGVLKPEMYK